MAGTSRDSWELREESGSLVVIRKKQTKLYDGISVVQ